MDSLPSLPFASTNVSSNSCKIGFSGRKIDIAIAIIIGVGSLVALIVGMGASFQMKIFSTLCQEAAISIVILSILGIGISAIVFALICRKNSKDTQTKDLFSAAEAQSAGAEIDFHSSHHSNQTTEHSEQQGEGKERSVPTTGAPNDNLSAVDTSKNLFEYGNTSCQRSEAAEKCCQFFIYISNHLSLDQKIRVDDRDINSIMDNNYFGDRNNAEENEHEFIRGYYRSRLRFRGNPWYNLQKTEIMQASVYDSTSFGISKALEEIFFSNNDTHGVILASKDKCISIYKKSFKNSQNKKVGIFHPQGNKELSGIEKNVAYIYKCERSEAINFIERLFRKVGKENDPDFSTVFIYPFNIRPYEVLEGA